MARHRPHMKDDEGDVLSISAVLPAYNEEQVIAASVAAMVKTLESLECDYEVIVVNDGSPDHTAEVLADYWPGVFYGDSEGRGVYSRFEWGDVEFFMLDDRYFRMPDTLVPSPGKSMLGREQMDWLLEGLKSSTATFKIVVCGSQVLNKLNQWEVLTRFPADYDRLMDFLRDEKVTGVMFLTGDRHWTELLKVDHPGISYPLYEFTSSPLTAGASRVTDNEKNNPMRVPGTFITDTRNFGMIETSGPLRDRKLTLRAVDWTGKEIWRHEIKQTDLGVIPRR